MFVAASLPLFGCRALVDPGVTYRACERAPYTEDFAPGATLEDLYERCWELANTEADPSDLFLDDGDLVVRGSEPASGRDRQWAGDDQGPFLFQPFEGDFLLVARVEWLGQITGDHCVSPGNAAGLAVRDATSGTSWSTFLIGPFEPADPAGIDCTGEGDQVPPTEAVVASRDGEWGPVVVERGADDEGIAVDGEADLAACRVNGRLVFYRRDPETTAESPVWLLVGGAAGAHEPGDGALDVGLTAAGAAPGFEVEAHFPWVSVTEGVKSDGCNGALDAVELPPFQ